MTGKLKIWFQEVRAPFFTASIIPILLGTMIAFRDTGEIHWLYFILTLLGGVFLHAGANVSNDYFDHLSKNDQLNKEFVRPFTGGSRVIQSGLLSPKEVLIGSLIFYLGAAFIGIYLTYKVSLVILMLGIIGAFSGFCYTAPPLFLVSRGIGELLIALNFGVLMTLGAYYVQTARFSWQPIIASLPVASLITAVLYINEFQDCKADKAVGKNHLVARFGKQKASLGYLILMLLTYFSLIIGVVTDTLPPSSLIGLITLPLAFRAIKVTFDFYDDSPKLAPANASTILNHLITGLLITISYVIDKYI